MKKSKKEESKVISINSSDDIQGLEVDEIYNFDENSNLEYKVQMYNGFIADSIDIKKVKKSSYKYLVYRKKGSEERWMITESHALMLASHFGYKSCKTVIKESLLDKVINNSKQSENIYKYIAEATIREPIFLGGEEYTFTASASEDNTDKMMHSYLPEMATKRALVRSILRAMKIFGILFDGETSNNNDIFINKKYNNKKEILKEKSSKIKPDKNKQIDTIYRMLEKPKYKKFDKLSEEELVYKFVKIKKRIQKCSTSQLEKIIYGMQQ